MWCVVGSMDFCNWSVELPLVLTCLHVMQLCDVVDVYLVNVFFYIFEILTKFYVVQAS